VYIRSGRGDGGHGQVWKTDMCWSWGRAIGTEWFGQAPTQQSKHWGWVSSWASELGVLIGRKGDLDSGVWISTFTGSEIGWTVLRV
jgi:hypothetical protein